MPKYWVYIIESIKDRWTYVGHTNNLQRRLKQHNSGKVKSTKAYIPFGLAYVEEHKGRGKAMRAERFLKSGKGRTIRGTLITKVECLV